MGVEKVNIQGVREQLEMTQEEFACRLGVNRATVWRWERGKSCPRKGILVAIKNLQTNVRSLAVLKKGDESLWRTEMAETLHLLASHAYLGSFPKEVTLNALGRTLFSITTFVAFQENPLLGILSGWLEAEKEIKEKSR